MCVGTTVGYYELNTPYILPSQKSWSLFLEFHHCAAEEFFDASNRVEEAIARQSLNKRMRYRPGLCRERGDATRLLGLPRSLIWHTGCVRRVGAFPSGSSDGTFPVISYMVSHRGQPIAMVRKIQLANEIARCRPRGYYAVQGFSIEGGIPARAKRPGRVRAGGAISRIASLKALVRRRKPSGKGPCPQSLSSSRFGRGRFPSS
jgi:hypothetical protein